MSRQTVESAPFTLEPFDWPSAQSFYRGWLRLGVVALLLLPDARASHELLGWLPFWLLCVPALALLQQRLTRPPRVQASGTAAALSGRPASSRALPSANARMTQSHVEAGRDAGARSPHLARCGALPISP
jgi:hypothetical protein